MVDPQNVIDESLPMLKEFLGDVGLHIGGDSIDYSFVLPEFSAWISQQEITADDRYYLSSRVGAFICEYLIDTADAERYIDGKRVLIRVPFADGIVREFDPYPLALGVADKQLTLLEVIQNIC